ncbi:sulfotransferase [Aestuariivirga sp.]|uniref:sulfotransferase n=1 Tax=Aestuariivirga sp. TaxID=2650926 RepID=UPI0039E36D69
MKYFCVSLHKSGTSSVHAWFLEAGIKALHYPKRVGGKNYVTEIRPVIDDNERIVDILTPVIDTYDGHSDAPWAGLYEEILRRRDDARFILIRRDPEAWWESLARHWQIDWLARRISAYEWIHYRKHLRLDPYRLITRKDRDLFIDAYRQHEQAVMQTIPAGRLLSFNLLDQDKGERLSEFTDLKRVVQFPHRKPVSSEKPLKKTYRAIKRRFLGSDLTTDV